MVQQQLFPDKKTEHGLARRTDPETSKAAAKSVDANELESRVLDVLRRHYDGLTTHQIAEYLGIPRDSVSPRIAPLVKKGLVVDSGLKREGPSGRKCIIWKAV